MEAAGRLSEARTFWQRRTGSSVRGPEFWQIATPVRPASNKPAPACTVIARLTPGASATGAHAVPQRQHRARRRRDTAVPAAAVNRGERDAAYLPPRASGAPAPWTRVCAGRSTACHVMGGRDMTRRRRTCHHRAPCPALSCHVNDIAVSAVRARRRRGLSLPACRRRRHAVGADTGGLGRGVAEAPTAL